MPTAWKPQAVSSRKGIPGLSSHRCFHNAWNATTFNKNCTKEQINPKFMLLETVFLYKPQTGYFGGPLGTPTMVLQL
jgi:hypothetical protein